MSHDWAEGILLETELLNRCCYFTGNKSKWVKSRWDVDQDQVSYHMEDKCLQGGVPFVLLV